LRIVYIKIAKNIPGFVQVGNLFGFSALNCFYRKQLRNAKIDSKLSPDISLQERDANFGIIKVGDYAKLTDKELITDYLSGHCLAWPSLAGNFNGKWSPTGRARGTSILGGTR